MTANVTDPKLKVKQPRERLPSSMDFINVLDPGETIGTISLLQARPSGLTIADQNIVGSKIIFWLSGGDDQVTYHVEAAVQTSIGATREADGDLYVVDK